MQFFEKSTNPLPSSKAKPGEWFDEFEDELLVKNSKTLQAWVNRAKPCPGAVRLLMPEGPSLGLRAKDKAAGVTRGRKLCIRIVLHSSPGCQCTQSTLVLTMFIWLRLGPKGILVRQFISPFDFGLCSHP
jgi:hypothetical protein